MTPKEKAKELFGKHYIICQEYTEEIQCSIQAKQCALISINLLMEEAYRQHDYEGFILYWKEVKQEIKMTEI
jgi:hypothetical protein